MSDQLMETSTNSTASTKTTWRVPGFVSPLLFLAVAAFIYFGVARSHGLMPGVEPAEQRKAMGALAMAKLDGGTWKLSDNKGKVVLLNFWATWCPPCRQETPGIIQLAADLKARGLEVVGVSMDEAGTPVIRKFIDDYHIPYSIVVPLPDSLIGMEVSALPTTFLIDRNGKVAKTYLGAVSEATFKADIESLLAE